MGINTHAHQTTTHYTTTRINPATTTPTYPYTTPLHPYTHTHHHHITDSTTIQSLTHHAHLIHELSSKTYPPFQNTPFSFSLTKKAAAHNSRILARHNHNLHDTLAAVSKHTQLEFGSEFRPTHDLEPILCHHPLWPRAKAILNQGCTVSLSPIDESTEHEDITLGLQRGNHKGALNQKDDLHTLLHKDVTHGYALPITKDAAQQISGGAWAPLNIQEQWSINEKGERIEKKRLTHDQSFPGLASEQSINARVNTDTLEPLIYGFMFMRVIHMIHAMRWAYPNIHIILCKFDLASAYRRMHLSAHTAAKCICSTTICALVYLRLTFGGSFSPAEWCVLIELLTDLGNDIINNPYWNQTTTQATQPPPASIPAPTLLPKHIPFAPALPADVSLNLPRHGWVDGYIDDLVGICLHLNQNATRTTRAILLAISIFARPTNTQTSNIPHPYILAMKKWIAEGTQEERKVVLGWVIDTRLFTVSLPQEKAAAYTQQINEILKAKKINHKNLESIIGRIERTAYAVPNAKFFINRLRHLLYHSAKRGWAYIPRPVQEDLQLHLQFIRQAAQGTSINNLVFRSPSHIYYADSCPFGMGGYSIKGRAWRFYIPPSLRSTHTNNLLEFIAQIVCIWIDALEGNLSPLSCCLGCSDSSSSVGWMYRSNFDPTTKPTHEYISRHLARILMTYNSTLYSQHQRGKHNLFADILSRWHFLTTIELTILLRSKFEKQLPTNFKISPLPNVISCWIISTLQRLQDQTQSRTARTKTETEHGDDGSPGWKEWASKETPTLTGLTYLKKSNWLQVLQSASDEANTVVQDTKEHWSLGRSARPSHVWQRPFRSTTNATPASQPTGSQTYS